MTAVDNGNPWLSRVVENHQIWLTKLHSGVRADLIGYTFNDVRLGPVVLKECCVRAVTLLNAELAHADLSGSLLEHVDFRNAILSQADLTGVDLIGSNCDQTWFPGANFCEAKLRQTMLRRAN